MKYSHANTYSSLHLTEEWSSSPEKAHNFLLGWCHSHRRCDTRCLPLSELYFDRVIYKYKRSFSPISFPAFQCCCPVYTLLLHLLLKWKAESERRRNRLHSPPSRLKQVLSILSPFKMAALPDELTISTSETKRFSKAEELSKERSIRRK